METLTRFAPAMHPPRWLSLSALSIAMSGCQTAAEMPQEGRTALGKADVFGSCASSDCNGPAEDGNCYCDDQCAAIGDCCEDKVELCDAACGDFKIEFEAAIGSGTGLSEVSVLAYGAGTGGTDKLLGTFGFLTSAFVAKKANLTKALAMNGDLILMFTGNRVQVRNLRLTHNGAVVYFFDAPTFQPTTAVPQWRWVPAAGDCDGAVLLPKETATVVKVDNQATLFVDTPEFQNAFVWAGVTSTPCAGTDTGTVELRWAEHDKDGLLETLQTVTRSQVLQDTKLTTKVGATGTIWLTATRGRDGDPKLPDGACDVQLYVEYR